MAEGSHSSRKHCHPIALCGVSAFWRDRAGILDVLFIPPAIYGFIVGLICLLLAQTAHAGGPEFVAGNTYFDPTMKGQPIVWSQGAVAYYTDQGDLSPILPGPTADAFVADAFARWTSLSTAALSASRGGQLAEDVNGSDVVVNADGSITMPTDVLSTATSTPVGVVYDYDGKVTDALLGAGSSDPLYCLTNAVFGGVDNFSTSGYLAHALVIMNGNCAQTTAQLPDVKYRLVRVLGKVLGLDWSQVNVNVITRAPVPSSDDFYGFPLMHYADLVSCVPVSLCYPNADQLRMDDRAAISRLYPVTAANLANFPGKQLFHDNTVRIHGSVFFTDSQGQAAQAMQGVNVVARWIDPSTGLASHRYSASFVSGGFFRANAGNAVTGPNDASGQPYARFGSDDTGMEGFFDLAGLEIPDGSSSAQYQLSVEAIDTNWSLGVGPYAPWQVRPSGTAQSVTVTVGKGSDVQQDLLMQGSAVVSPDGVQGGTYDSPASLPAGGDWTGSLGTYGETDYFQFSGQAYRTMTVAVTALDDAGAASENKMRPMVGIWSLSDPAGTLAPAATSSPFNSAVFGMSRLDASLLSGTDFRIGIADDRGDGRPDFRYHAHVIYADSLAPARASMRGGTPLIIQGIGFGPGMTASIGGSSVAVLSVSADEVIISAPAPAVDGVKSVTLTDPVTGGFSTMVDALTFGAASTDNIKIISGGGNPAVPVGGETPVPIVVQVTTADGMTPVSGASVAWNASSGTVTACGVAPACTVATDDSGQASTRIIPNAAGTITVTAALAPAAYSSPKKAQATVVATSAATAITLGTQYRWLAYGGTVDLPLVARVMSYSNALSGAVVNFQVVKGAGTLTQNSAATDVNGYASSTLHVASLTGDVQVSACVAPSNAPCQTFYFATVALSAIRLIVVGGGGQMVNVGQSFAPVFVRVNDSASPPHSVQGAVVTFQTTILRPDQDAPVEQNGETGSSNHRMPVILGSSQGQVSSDANGLASAVPSVGSSTGAVELEITISAGANATQQLELESLWPVPTGGGGSTAAAGSSTASRNSTKVGGTTSAPAQNYIAGEIWAVAGESGSGTSPTLIAVPDVQTGALTSDQPKSGDEAQPGSACDRESGSESDCANRAGKSDSPE